ncbi:type III secretion effector protein [Pseudomonas costantinii]|uniref:Type III effector n=1 Tax=Pseudomonas costantinii TaxID=168469 RepID=A0A1H5ISV2_9PSED|nr:type III secretion effector protein [Pseudomonas costantinii]SEE43282.1 hypothetical protein SAMN04515675_5505 [Pseudomonas costantinii]
MSISTLDTPVSVSSTTDTSQFNPKPDAKASRPAPAAPSYDGGNNTGGVNFSRENQAGPMFGDRHPPTHRHSDHNHFAHHQNTSAMTPALPQGLLQQLQQWLGQWFVGQRPPMHSHCDSAPPRPDPSIGKPHPHPHPHLPVKPGPNYSTKSNEQLGQALLDNFKAFSGSSQSMTMNTSAIKEMAGRPLGRNPVMNQNIQLARELMRRPEVIAAFDRNSGTGALDGQIDKRQLGSVIRDDNLFKYKTDKEIGQEMLSHFNQLKEGFGGREINIRDLKNWPLNP